MSIRLAIFDLGGTIVDKFSLSPFISLKQAFKKKRINVNNNLIYKDMGMNKYEHIEEILNDKYTRRIWFKLYGEYPNSSSVMSVYDEFIKYQMNEKLCNRLEKLLDKYLEKVKAPKWQPGITWKENSLKIINSYH